MITLAKDKILFEKSDWFSAEATLLCGQVFRYKKITDAEWQIFSADKNAYISVGSDGTTAVTANDAEYFYDYFDCKTDYGALSKQIEDLPFMSGATKYSFGLRLLKQQPFETLISFIISANNHIPRIRSTIEKLCAAFSNDNDISAPFPSPKQMASVDVAFYAALGAGYRAEYLLKTAKAVADGGGFDLENLKILDTENLLTRLQTLPGVGPKVADCIALFAYGRQDVFPVDTWVKKIYRDIFSRDDNPKTIRKKLLELYGENAGLAQQFLFHFKRSGENH